MTVTVVHREPEWDDYQRSEARALVLDERRTCKRCGSTDSFEPLNPAELPVTWPGGRTFVVRQFRCLGCASLDLVQRDYDQAHKDHKPEPGKYAPGDGFRLAVDERR